MDDEKGKENLRRVEKNYEKLRHESKEHENRIKKPFVNILQDSLT